VTVEIAIRNRSTPDAGVELLGREQQVLYRTLAARPEWQQKVIEAVPAEIRAAVRANLKRRGAPENMSKALFSYNSSEHYVKAIAIYADVIRTDERTYVAYHAWQVFYGDRVLPEGFDNP